MKESVLQHAFKAGRLVKAQRQFLGHAFQLGLEKGIQRQPQLLNVAAAGADNVRAARIIEQGVQHVFDAKIFVSTKLRLLDGAAKNFFGLRSHHNHCISKPAPLPARYSGSMTQRRGNPRASAIW